MLTTKGFGGWAIRGVASFLANSTHVSLLGLMTSSQLWSTSIVSISVDCFRFSSTGEISSCDFSLTNTTFFGETSDTGNGSFFTTLSLVGNVSEFVVVAIRNRNYFSVLSKSRREENIQAQKRTRGTRTNNNKRTGRPLDRSHCRPLDPKFHTPK